MDDEVVVVAYHPFAFSGAGPAVAADSLFTQHALNLAQQSLQMGRAVAGGNNVKIRHPGKTGNVEDLDVFALFRL